MQAGERAIGNDDRASGRRSAALFAPATSAVRVSSPRWRGWAASLMVLCGAAAADNGPVEATTPAAVGSEARVVVFNRTVAVFRSPFVGITAERRARRTEAILHELLAKSSEGNVSVQIEPQGHLLLVDGELALVLTSGDTDLMRGETLTQASQAARETVKRIWAETRESRDKQRLIYSTFIGLVATLVAGVAAAMIWRLRTWSVNKLSSVITTRATGLRLAGAELLQTDRLVAVMRLAARALSWLTMLVLAYQWLSFVLEQFPYTRPWGEGLTAYLIGVVAALGKGMLGALPELLIAVAIFLMARAVIAMFKPFFARVQMAGTAQVGWLDADTARPTQRLFSVAVWVFALVMA